MAHEMMHFRNSDKIISGLKMKDDLKLAAEYIDAMTGTTKQKGSVVKTALQDLGWRENGSLAILDTKRYEFKGRKQKIAIEANLDLYEYIVEGLFRLQIGYDKGKIKAGILFLAKPKYEKELKGCLKTLERDVMELYPSITLPVTVVLFDCEEQKELAA